MEAGPPRDRRSAGAWMGGARSVTDLLATLQELEHLEVGFVSLIGALDLTTLPGQTAEFEREIL